LTPVLRRRAPRAIVFALLLAATAAETHARVPRREAAAQRDLAPKPLLPLAGDRLPEGTARLEVATGSGAKDVRVVVARWPFAPSSWSTLPGGSAWAIVPYAGKPIALAPLGLADRTDTELWWAVVWTDSATGSLRASEVRELTLVPRFANREGVSGTLAPSASGQLPARAVAPVVSGKGRRTIELAAGYSLSPGGPDPDLPVALRHRRGALAAAAAGDRDAFIVQFGDDSPDSARARIARASGSIAWPISGDGYLVRMDADGVAKLRAQGGEPWVAPYEPAYKLSRALDPTAAGAADVTALLFADGDDDATISTLRALGATRISSQRSPRNHLARFTLDRARLPDAAGLAGVAWIEPTPVYTFDNDRAQWVVQSGVQNSRPVTDHGLRGQGQVLMICDSGLRTNHEMFFDSTLAIDTWGDYPKHRKIIAYKPGMDSPDITFGDDVGHDYHGTHTSGTLAGNPDPYSAAPWSGMAKDARLYFMDVGGTNDATLHLPDDLYDVFQPSYTGNAAGAARISSNSWGANAQGAYTLASMQVDQFVWDHPDYLIAFAAGNIGTFASVNAPGSAKNCLTVGATGNGTLENMLASFSSRGPTQDGRRKPTVMGPGDQVTSSIANTRYTYATYSGTSMATPAVAGAMALARQYLTDGWYPTGAPVKANGFKPSAALLRAMAVAGARNDVAGFHVPDNTIGYGRLTLDDVLYFPGDTSRTLLVDPPDGLTDGRYVEYQVQVTDPTQPLKVALCWTDAPGNPASAVQLVNDLDLQVLHDGATYRGNYLLNYASVDGGVRDSLNVEELVRLPAPAAGLWTVRVEAHRVLQGPQPFALCITGGVGGPSGAIALDRFEYGLGDELEVEVIDTDAPGPISAHVTSSTEPAGETVTLTGSNGVFRGSIVIAPVPVNPGDGTLAVTSGDVVSATYTDASPAAQVTATARVNVQSPTITDVHAVALGATRAQVTWTTDLAASSLVRYGSAGALNSVATSSGFATRHSVVLDELTPGTLYRYDLESSAPRGELSRDSLDGAHRTFTTPAGAAIALVMDDPDPDVLATWLNALAALGWNADVLTGTAIDPPLVGNSAAGLRHYEAVLWQVDPNRYPPFSDAQRAAIDSLLNGGGRLLVTGHDIGFGLSDAGSPTYSPEREAWLEHGLKTRYYADNYNADTLSGVAGSPVTGAYVAGIPYALWLYPDSGDNVGAAPGTDGTWYGDWTENYVKSGDIGMRWESNTPHGTPGAGVWGGQTSRLVGLFYEWRALAGASTAHLPARTGVLQDATAWLLGHRPPEVHLTQPAPGTVVTTDALSIHYSLRPDAGRAIAGHAVDVSLDGGETWAPATTATCADSGCVWDLSGVLGGPATPNSANVRLRVRVTDDGAPALSSESVMSGSFALARPGGDTRGPVAVAGSVSCSPTPVRRDKPTTLFATFSDGERGGGTVVAAEYAIGSAPAAAGAGAPMSGTFGTTTVQASAALATASTVNGIMRVWVRARDGAGNWGTAAAIDVLTTGTGTLAVGDPVAADFLARPSPNPFRGRASFRFGLARAGEVQLELYDVSGRRVRSLAGGTLAAGEHSASWDGRDQQGNAVAPGVYFVRLTTPSRSFHARLVSLE
jgi:hypothetical protein